MSGDAHVPPLLGPTTDRPAPALTRTRFGRVQRDVLRQLSEALDALAEEPGSPSVDAAVASLEEARTALSLLALERAAGGTTPGGPRTPALVQRLQLEPAPASSQLARAFCRDTCAAWQLPDPTATSALDICSELVANAVRHTAHTIVVALELRPTGLLVSVWDDGPGRPRLLPYRPGISERGIGLRLVKQLSEQWGSSDEQEGKWVWARLSLPSADAD